MTGDLDGLLALLAAEPTDDLSALLAELRWLVLKHPVAARAAFRALLAEGRRFAETEDGARWKHRLHGSELVRRGQAIWEIGTMNLLDDEGTVLPTQLIDAFCYATTRRNLEPELARVFEPDHDEP